jgi:hypothetical protein
MDPSTTAASADISLAYFAIGLLEAAILALALRCHHLRFAATFSNRQQLGNVLVPLVITTFLVILVVKSSLALSLGLVGALSIVRFRTPIKEPEDLVYLFVAIAIGLGIGAGQYVVTGLATLASMLAITWMHRSQLKGSTEFNFFVDIEEAGSPAKVERAVLARIQATALAANLTKLERAAASIHLSATIRLESEESLHKLIDEIMAIAPQSRCTFLDSKSVFI